VLSVLRKPVQIYIATTLVLIRSGKDCWCLDRSPTLPLAEALHGLNDNISKLKLGRFRRASVFLSTALCPPLTGQRTEAEIAPHALQTIEKWALRIGFLPSGIRPLWSVCTELPDTQSDEIHGLYLSEPDSSTALIRSHDGSVVSQSVDEFDNLGTALSDLCQQHQVDPSGLLKLRFKLAETKSDVSAHVWRQHWERL
jgi:hypothetical protein